MTVNPDSKIQKLIRLSESSNTHEAKLAMLRALELSAKHNRDFAILFSTVCISRPSRFVCDESTGDEILYDSLAHCERYLERMSAMDNYCNEALTMILSQVDPLRFPAEEVITDRWKTLFRSIIGLLDGVQDFASMIEPPTRLLGLQDIYIRVFETYSTIGKTCKEAAASLDRFDLDAYSTAICSLSISIDLLIKLLEERRVYFDLIRNAQA